MPESTISAEQIGGLILAGGNARRMQNADKGLVLLHKQALISHVINKLRPQVAYLAISANRNLANYAQFDLPVLCDEPQWRGMGPLAGIASIRLPNKIKALQIVPCDTPFLPINLVSKLSEALNNNPQSLASYAQTAQREHPSVLLLRAAALDYLPMFLAQGNRKLLHWLKEFPSTSVLFANEDNFANINDYQTLQQYQSSAPSNYS